MATYTPSNNTTYTSSQLVANDILSVPYSGVERAITLPAGSYKFECYGAQGGDGARRSTSSTGQYSVQLTEDDFDTYLTSPVGLEGFYFSGTYNQQIVPDNIGLDGSIRGATLNVLKAGTYDIYCSFCTEASYDVVTINGETYSGDSSVTVSLDLTSSDSLSFGYSKDSSVSATGEYVYFEITYTGSDGVQDTSVSSGGGYGGYSYGTINFTKPTKIYCYTGGKGGSSTSAVSGTTTSGGWNGGGSGKVNVYSNYWMSAGGGGGGSDIRIGGNTLYHRVIVAGGGGGRSSSDVKTTCRGGGASGYTGGSSNATQTAAGTGGSFGQGANLTSYNYSSYIPGGGGGGWYGGGTSNTSYMTSSSYASYGGGGSGYVYTSATAADYPSGCALTNQYYLTNATTTTSTRTGNGHIQITVLSITPEESVISNAQYFIKTDTTTWSPISAIYIKTSNNYWSGGTL